MAKETITTCRHCGAEIAAAAKTCPKCGGSNKKPIFKRVWFWVLIAVLVLGFGGCMGGSGDSDSSGSDSSASQAEQKIEYTAVTVDEMTDALDSNAAAASDKYDGQYLEITGRLSNIDSDGNYISLSDMHDDWAVIGVTCYIKNDEQLDKVKSMSVDQEVTVRGKITEVGEVLGYSLDIDSIK